MGCGIGLRFHMAAATLEELNILRLHRFARNFGSSWLQRFAQLSLSVTAFLLRKVGALEFHRFVAVATYGENTFEFEASRFRLFVSDVFVLLHFASWRFLPSLFCCFNKRFATSRFLVQALRSFWRFCGFGILLLQHFASSLSAIVSKGDGSLKLSANCISNSGTE